MKRSWQQLPIKESGEYVEDIPSALLRIDPHPYASLGAPYGKGLSPWTLRSSVIKLLLTAQKDLKKKFPDLSLIIFDAFRPISVQSFMIDNAIKKEYIARGLNKSQLNHDALLEDVIESVNRFWAPPSFDPKTPPPHSTGGAIDLTLSDLDGNPIDMGSEIDEIGKRSEPNYYSQASLEDVSGNASLWNFRRNILKNAMINAGFVQHPNEWWHYSYGDQLWAWKNNFEYAIYGRVKLNIDQR